MRVSVIDGRRCGSVRLANVHKLGAEIRYLTNLRNLRELFRYPSPENSGGRQSRTKISVGSFSKYLISRPAAYKTHDFHHILI